ncbi:MAG TPA: type I polyketide synthase [Streptosporangiaceae bacterium]|nr:type I polyketide synthase [Streptosporangiaceae bacterium]
MAPVTSQFEPSEFFDEVSATAGGPPPPIAIVGMGCRFPGGADNPAAYWEFLAAGGDGLVEIPADRWRAEKFYASDASVPGMSRVRRGGFLAQRVDEFDAAFFGISPREADYIDPQQRLLLEVAWEALEDAGATLDELAGSATGVFVGGFTLDYSQLQFGGVGKARTNLGAHTATGIVMTMFANRISHAFDLCGPSLTVDTACSSSLVAVHLACRSLWSGESTMALAGGVNLMLTPNFTIAASQGGFLSPTSQSRAFDAAADGYVRGEGAGVVVLKPLADALRDGDNIYAVIRGTAVTQDGHTNGITVPNGESQKRAVRNALKSAGVAATSVCYVEAHGTGTPVGDPIEVNAIGEIYGANRPAGDRCLVASVKTNIGHLEAAAGIAALIKTALCLQRRQVPPHLNLTTLNPKIDLDQLGLAVPRVCQPLPESGGLTRAAVNSFGFGGTNAHAILEAAPVAHAPSTAAILVPAGAKGLVPVLPLSARSAAALTELAGRYRRLADDYSLAELAPAVAHRRTQHHQARIAVVTDSLDELKDALESFSAGSSHPAVHSSVTQGAARPLGFVFTGLGPQWWGMGRQLLEESPVFRAVIERCDAALTPLAGWSLMDELSADEAASRMAETAVLQPANFALQLGLAELWSGLGVVPEAIVGHSAGEVAAAYVAGALSFEDAITVIYHRARLQQLTSGEGHLLAVAIPEARALELPAVRDGFLHLAAVNSPVSVALVGDQRHLTAVKDEFDAEDIFCRFVHGDVPFHSPRMDRLEADIRRCLGGIKPAVPVLPLYSTVTGDRITEAAQDAGYWWRNVRQQVRFADATFSMIDNGITGFLEIGPHPAMSLAVTDCLAARKKNGFALPSLKRKDHDGSVISHTCAELYATGYLPDWSAYYPKLGALALPAYPWQRQSFWMEADGSRQDRLGLLDHPLLGNRRDVPKPNWLRTFDGTRPPYLADHRVMDANLFPGAGYVEMALAVARECYETPRCTLEQIRFHAPVVLQENPAHTLDTTLDTDTGLVEIYGKASTGSDWVLNASAQLRPAAESVPLYDVLAARMRCVTDWDAERCYEHFRASGFDYGPCFQIIEQLWIGEKEAVAHFDPKLVNSDNRHELNLIPMILDGCFQTLLPLVGSPGTPSLDSLLPFGVDRIVVHGPADGDLWAHATATEISDDSVAGDVVLTDVTGRVIVEVRGFRLRVLGAGQRPHGAVQHGTEWLYDLAWQPQPAGAAGASPVKPGTWLVLADRAGIADALIAQLARAGQQAVVARAGDAFAENGPHDYHLRPDQPEDLRRLIRLTAEQSNGSWRGIVHIWSCDTSPDDLGPGDLAAAMRNGPSSVLHLVQAMEAENLASPLWLITKGGQPVDGQLDGSGLLQAPMWGLGRVLHQESLALQARLIDLDPQHPEDDLPALAAELLADTQAEDQVAWRAGIRLVPRLQPAPRHAGSFPAALRADASYLITGGLGALGLLFARWMAERGARRLILMARSRLPDRGKWAALPAEDPCKAQVDRIRDIEALGTTIELVSLDVADQHALRRFLDQRQSDDLPPVRGVIHAAGSVQDQVMTRMDEEQLLSVLRPKILGSWALHECLKDEPLDFFAMFSSVSSVVVTAGQANYAAGNAFLDALAYYRRGLGLNALSVNWGPWDTGMIAQLGLQSLYASRGIDLLPERTGVRLFEQILGSAVTQQIVVSASWPTLIASYPIVPRLIEHLGQQADQEATADETTTLSVLERISAASAQDASSIAADACADIIGGVLRIRAADLSREEPLIQLGLDSMIAVELRIRLEQAFGVAPRVVFLLQGANVTGVADFICSGLVPPAAAEMPEDLAQLMSELDPATAEALLAEIEQPSIKQGSND